MTTEREEPGISPATWPVSPCFEIFLIVRNSIAVYITSSQIIWLGAARYCHWSDLLSTPTKSVKTTEQSWKNELTILKGKCSFAFLRKFYMILELLSFHTEGEMNKASPLLYGSGGTFLVACRTYTRYSATWIISTAEQKLENSFSDIFKTPSINIRAHLTWISQNQNMRLFDTSGPVKEVTTTRTR